MNRITNLNENAFNEIKNEETAYFLGLLYADGNLIKNKIWDSWQLSITQSEKDLDIIYNIQKFLETDRKIHESYYNDNKYYTLSVNSKQLCLNLLHFGIVPNKSLVLTFPNFISDDLMPHFIRGYFDGDGSIWEGKRKLMIVKNEKKTGTTRKRIIHNVKFNITGSNTFIPDLQKFLIEKCGFSKTKLNYSKTKTTHKHCSLEYSGRKNVYKLYTYMYSNATIFGKRKKDKFEKILEYGHFKNISNK